MRRDSPKTPLRTRTLGMLGPFSVREFGDVLRPGGGSADLPPGLGGTPVNLLVRELLRRGQRVTVLTLDPAVEREIVREGGGLRVCIGPFRRVRARDFFAEERRYLLSALRREQPDVVHAQWTYEYALAVQASGLPHVITAHDAPLNVLRRNFIPYRIARTLMAYGVLHRARRVVSVSPYVADHLRRYMLYRGPKEVIPNGMEDAVFGLGAAPPRRGAISFGTVLTGWTELKNGRVALEAFARIRERRPADRLVMFGVGHEPGGPAERLARELGVERAVELAGHVPHGELLRRLAGEVDVLVHPSLEEAQPMAVTEAMALGIPVIGGSRSGGVPWTLAEGRAGLLVDVTSAEAVARAMERLAGDDAAREEWGRKGREHAARHFHIRAVADAYEAVYEDLLARREHGARRGRRTPLDG